MLKEVASDLACMRVVLVNVVCFGRPSRPGGEWVLVDAGIGGFSDRIARAARQRFPDPPSAIVLTHGHFDHVGSLMPLAKRWNVPIYAHTLELPFLNGSAEYPPPNPLAGGGLIALSSSLFPRGPYDFRPWLQPLPEDGTVPHMPGWQWIHTPGHTRGHVSLWRASDRTLIAGDAVITTRQESLTAVLTQRPELHGPPMYFTEDWQASADSTRRLASLKPELLITGHGVALQGPQMQIALQRLADRFETVATPKPQHLRPPAAEAPAQAAPSDQPQMAGHSQ